MDDEKTYTHAIGSSRATWTTEGEASDSGKIGKVPPIPDSYKLDATDLACLLQEWQPDNLRSTINRIARWLMERDERWSKQ